MYMLRPSREITQIMNWKIVNFTQFMNITLLYTYDTQHLPSNELGNNNLLRCSVI